MLPSDTVDPKIRQFLEALSRRGGPPIYKLSVLEARAVLTLAQASEIDVLPADVEDRTIPGGAAGQVVIRVVRPRGRSEALPVILYIHGGGWVLGDVSTHDRLVREIANGAEAAVVFVAYTPSPESQYPAPMEECYAALEWVAANGASMGLDVTRIAVAGDSVGGNLATVVGLLARQRGGPALVSQALFYPVTNADLDTPSYRAFATGYFLERDGMKWFWDQYLPNPAARAEPTASPLQAPIELLRGSPRTLIITAENDVLCDEGEAYAHALMQAGVEVRSVRVLGAIHDFMMLNAIAHAPPTRAAVELASGWFREVFSAAGRLEVGFPKAA